MSFDKCVRNMNKLIDRAIAEKQQEIDDLTRKRDVLAGIVNGQTRVSRSSKKRIDWMAVHAKLPRRFTVQEAAKIAGDGAINVTLARWVKQGLAISRGRGRYEKRSGTKNREAAA